MISGTPTAQASPANYVITATNSGGQSSGTLTLAVSAAPLLDLGHAGDPSVNINPTDLGAIQIVSSNSVYSPIYNSAYSLTTGAVLWTSASGNSLGATWTTMGAVAGSETVLASSHWVLAELNSN